MTLRITLPTTLTLGHWLNETFWDGVASERACFLKENNGETKHICVHCLFDTY